MPGDRRTRTLRWAAWLGSLVACATPGPDGEAPPDDADTQTGGSDHGSTETSDTDDATPHEPEGGYADPWAMGAVGLRRQTTGELRNTLKLVLGVEDTTLDEVLAVLPGDSETPFDNDYGTQEPSAPLIDGMLNLAEVIAAEVVSDPDRLSAAFGCAPAGPGDEACLRSGASRVGRLLLRRPLDDEELDRYAGFMADAEEEGDFGVAAQLAIRAFLLDPEFLYRIVVGDPVPGEAQLVRLTDYELAARLSFLLWGSGPDEALLDLVADGGLQTPTDVFNTAQEMAASPRALRQLQRLHAMWLGYDKLSVEPSLAASLRTETDKLVERSLADRAWLDLFTAEQSYLDATLSAHYDIALPQGKAGWVDYPDVRRGGILSHGSFLAIGKKFADTSPVERGKAVWTRLLCNDMPPPPPDIDTGLPPSGGPADACKEQRYDMATKTECASCHTILDPLGFGLENYGPAGEWRTREPDRPDCTIEGRGDLSGAGKFAGPAALGKLLVDTGQLEGCFVRHVYQFAVGRRPSDADAVMLDALTESFEDKDDFVGLLVEFAASEGFAHRVIEEGQ